MDKEKNRMLIINSIKNKLARELRIVKTFLSSEGLATDWTWC